MLAIGQWNALQMGEDAKPKFVVRSASSTIDVGVKRAMSHGRCGINTVELYSGFDGALLIEIACKAAFHAVIPHFSSMLLACAGLSHEQHASSVHGEGRGRGARGEGVKGAPRSVPGPLDAGLGRLERFEVRAKIAYIDFRSGDEPCGPPPFPRARIGLGFALARWSGSFSRLG